MTRAELAAEVLRIHDLIAAEPGPRTPEEWTAIDLAVERVRHKVVKATAEAAERAKQPQPRMVDGIGLCTSSCPALRPMVTELDRKVMGKCAVSDTQTACGVPCRPWVDALRQETASALGREHRHECTIHELRKELAGERAEKEGILRRSEHAEALNRKLQERIRAMLPDLQHEPAEERPCEQVIGDRKMCGTPTVCRNTSGYPLCRAHGGRNPVPEMNP